ncbi:MAG: hypothetical protein ACPGOY_09225 [Rhodospirillaceae bacterium]
MAQIFQTVLGVLLLSCATLLGSAEPARADDYTTDTLGQIDGWTLDAGFRGTGRDRVFSDCNIWSIRENNHHIFFYLGFRDIKGFGLIHDSWAVPDGHAPTVRWRIDDGPWHSDRGRKFASTGLFISVPKLEEIVTQIKPHSRLTFKLWDKTQVLTLPGAANALSSLFKCYRDETRTDRGRASGPAPRSNQPFFNSSPTLPSQDVPDPGANSARNAPPPPSQSEESYPVDVGPWRIHAHYGTNSNNAREISECTMVRDTRRPPSLAVFFGKGEVPFGFILHDAAWRLPHRAQYEVDWQASLSEHRQNYWLQANAQALNANTLVVSGDSFAENIVWLNENSEMRLRLRGKIYRFDIRGFGQALPTLFRCGIQPPSQAEPNPPPHTSPPGNPFAWSMTPNRRQTAPLPSPQPQPRPGEERTPSPSSRPPGEDALIDAAQDLFAMAQPALNIDGYFDRALGILSGSLGDMTMFFAQVEPSNMRPSIRGFLTSLEKSCDGDIREAFATDPNTALPSAAFSCRSNNLGPITATAFGVHYAGSAYMVVLSLREPPGEATTQELDRVAQTVRDIAGPPPR